MKKIILITGLFLGSFAFAQAPEKMSYQAVVRNATGQLVQNQNVGIKASVLQNSATGTVVYSESLTGTTNANGLVSLAIGSGTVLSGTFASIDWSTGNYYLKTETDPTGGTNYTIAGTSQLLSVPYAMYAKSSGNGSGTSQWGTNGTDIFNANTGNVGIGTNTPSNKLTVKSGEIGISQESPDGNVKVGFYTNNGAAFLQTHTNHDLSFSTNNGSQRMVLQKETGNIGIGTSVPTEKLEVAGKTKTTNLQVTNGAAAGNILTSDATGNATWQNKGDVFIFKKMFDQTFATMSSAKIHFEDINTTPGVIANAAGFTASKSGFYQFNVNLSLRNDTGTPFNNHIRVFLQKQNGSFSQIIHRHTLTRNGSTDAQLPPINFSTIVFLDQGDVVSVELENSSASFSVVVNGENNLASSKFSGSKLD